MNTLEKQLKEVQSRTTEYFEFIFNKEITLGSRLKKWRELNKISKTDMAEALYNYRCYLCLEDDDNKSLSKEKRISSLIKTYSQWETKETDSFFASTPFSLENLFILKHLLHCDYEFLFGEIDTLHKHTKALTKLTGLTIASIEKLLSYFQIAKSNNTMFISTNYSRELINTLDLLISDDDFMTYLSYYITEYKSEDVSPITITKPVAGIASEDAYMDGNEEFLNTETVNLIYKLTISNKLCQLRDQSYVKNCVFEKSSIPYVGDFFIADPTDTLGERLKKWRKLNNYTQQDVCDLILLYYMKHNLRPTPSNDKEKATLKATILRNYQNWESKRDASKDTRLSMHDIQMLKEIMNCDYEFLFGEINSLKVPELTIYNKLGLSEETVEKLENYSNEWIQEQIQQSRDILTTINLLLTDNDLLTSLAYFFSDLPYIVNTDSKILLDEKECKNIFLPAICECFNKLHKQI